MPDVGVSTLLEAIAHVRPLHHRHMRWWFRGQPDASHELVPGVFRSRFCAVPSDRLKKERHLSQDFRVLGAGRVGRSLSDAEWYFLQQHYGMPTRLLDWTPNALAALFFAIDGDPDLDGAVHMMDVYQLSTTQTAPAEYEGIATSRRPVVTDLLKPIFDWAPEPGDQYILAIRPDHFDRRMNLQRSCFTWHVPGREVLNRTHNTTLTAYRIPADRKGPIRDELRLLGVDEFSVYGDLPALAKALKATHEVR